MGTEWRDDNDKGDGGGEILAFIVIFLIVGILVWKATHHS